MAWCLCVKAREGAWRRLRARSSRRLWGQLGGIRGAVSFVHRVFQLPFPACVGRS